MGTRIDLRMENQYYQYVRMRDLGTLETGIING